MIEINNKTRSKINLALVRKVTGSFLKVYQKKNYQISIAFVGDKTIRKLNKIYRQVDKITDVLAFPEITGEVNIEENFLGEIIINHAQIKRQAKRFNNSIKGELVFILVHGLLHLMGYDDRTEEGRREMEGLGRRFIKKAKMVNRLLS